MSDPNMKEPRCVDRGSNDEKSQVLKSDPNVDDQDKALDPLTEAVDDIVKPKGKHVAMFGESLRMMSGVDRYSRMQDDAWLSGALRQAVSALDSYFDYEADSFQNRLLQKLDEINPDVDVWQQFEQAKEVRRGGLQDLAARALTGEPYAKIKGRLGKSALLKGATVAPGISGMLQKAKNVIQENETDESGDASRGSLDPRELAIARLAILFPDQVLPGEAFRQMMNLALLGGRGTELISGLAGEFAKSERNRKTLGINDHEVEMTINWTNPDYPLWLAEMEALAAMLRLEFCSDDVTEEGAKGVRNRKLKCDSLYPIVGYVAYKNGEHSFQLDSGLEVVPPSRE